MTTRDAGLTKEQVEAAEVHAAGSSHCGEIKSKSAFSRHSTRAWQHMVLLKRLGLGAAARGGARRRPARAQERQPL
jgi:hypothetical protein